MSTTEAGRASTDYRKGTTATSSEHTSEEGTRDDAGAVLHDAYGKAKEMVGGAIERGSSFAGEAVERSRHYYDRGTSAVGFQIRERPLISLLVAGAVGYALAWLVHSGRFEIIGEDGWRSGETRRHR